MLCSRQTAKAKEQVLAGTLLLPYFIYIPTHTYIIHTYTHTHMHFDNKMLCGSTGTQRASLA